MPSGSIHRYSIITTCVVLLCLSLASGLNIRTSKLPLVGIESETRHLENINECTTGVASGATTPDGRPLLWKNRDVGNPEQEYHFVDDGRIPFIGLTYAGITDRYFAGINAAGFGIENASVHNMDPQGGNDEGARMKLALATCRTVDQFQAILDSTNDPGRLYCSNYGIIDAFGGAVMFETGRWSYTRLDADQTDDGFIVRSNFAFSGEEDLIDDYIGLHRYRRAHTLWKNAVDDNNLTPQYIYREVVRDLSSPGFDPYPLPFDGYYEDCPYGCLPNDLSICRSSTRSVMIAQGVRSGERPDDAVIWAMLGSPLSGIATPLWVRAGSVPVEYDGDQTSSISERAEEISDWIYVETDWIDKVDTWRLANRQGNGFLDFSLPLENYIFDRVDRFLASPRFSYDRLEAFQNEIAQQINDSLEAWQPPYRMVESFDLIFEANNIVLVWGGNEGLRDGEAIPEGYIVYRSASPFRENNSGERLAFVEGTRYVDHDPPINMAFYRVEVVF